MLLKSKLNCNKGDFERLRKLGTSGKGAMGADLESQVGQHSERVKEILSVKKEAHRGPTDIRKVMSAILEAEPSPPDLSQVEDMCKILDDKDRELLSNLCSAKDTSEKEYLANYVANGLRNIMKSDKADIEQHVIFNNSGMDKLHKMIEKHKILKEKQKEIFSSQEKTKQAMNDQIKMLQLEKQATLEAIERAKQELKRLHDELQRLKNSTEDKDAQIADLDAQVDDLFNQMEEHEYEIALKNQ